MTAALITFDLDGTLVDSRRDLAESANDMLASFGVAPISIDAVAGMVGDGAAVLVRRVLAAGGVPRPAVPEALERFLDAYGRRLLDHTGPYPGVPEMLSRLSGRAALAVLTNKPTAYSDRLLAGLGLAACFGWIVGGDSPFGRKPDPGGLRHLMTASGASSERTMHVGDSMVDVETARCAGVGMCLARYGYGAARGDLALDGSELAPGSVPELQEALERWLARTS